jgi:hypothetical protein
MKAQLRIIATLAVFVLVSIGIASGQDDPDDSAQRVTGCVRNRREPLPAVG